MRVIFTVMNTTKGVVKIKPKKKNFQAFFHYCKHSVQFNGNDHPRLH